MSNLVFFAFRGVGVNGCISFNGWGLTAFDSLDTMLIMELETEYQKGLDVIRRANFSVAQVCLPTPHLLSNFR